MGKPELQKLKKQSNTPIPQKIQVFLIYNDPNEHPDPPRTFLVILHLTYSLLTYLQIIRVDSLKVQGFCIQLLTKQNCFWKAAIKVPFTSFSTSTGTIQVKIELRLKNLTDKMYQAYYFLALWYLALVGYIFIQDPLSELNQQAHTI